MKCAQFLGVRNEKAIGAAGAVGGLVGSAATGNWAQAFSDPAKLLGAIEDTGKQRREADNRLLEAIGRQTTILAEIRDRELPRPSAGAAAAQPLN